MFRLPDAGSAGIFTCPQLDRLFGGLTKPLALAVSGGSDSVALMHLVAAWRRAGGGMRYPVPLVLTVDHGLRPGSSDEALFVAGQAQQLGFVHQTLPWLGAKPTTGIQNAARNERYRLLLERLATDDEPRDLVTAHTQDDQAETLLMRLARGSGLDGLSAMRPRERRVVVKLGDPVREVFVDLRRPLLDVSKDSLIGYLRSRGASWIDDPSNRDDRFERVRLRGHAGALESLGLTPESLARTARRLQNERVALQARAAVLAQQMLVDHQGAYGELVVSGPEMPSAADLNRLLACLLEVFGGEGPKAQLSQIETLVERVMSKSSHGAGGITLGGCIVEISVDGDATRLRVFREYGRQSLPTVSIAPGEGIFWDRRFYISLAPDAPKSVAIGPMGEGANRARSAKLPHRCVVGLPRVLDLDLSGGVEPLLPPGSGQLTCRWPPQLARRLFWSDRVTPEPETN